MKRLYLSLSLILALCFFVTPAFADIFGPRNTDLLKLPAIDKTFNQRVMAEQSKEKLNIEPDTILGYITEWVTYLGPKTGYGYDFIQKDWVQVTGSTLYTTHNFSLDLNLLGAIGPGKGAGLGLNYNVGSLLPVQNSPLFHFFNYLYVEACAGARNIDDVWKGSVIADAKFKLTF